MPEFVDSGKAAYGRFSSVLADQNMLRRIRTPLGRRSATDSTRQKGQSVPYRRMSKR